MKKSFKLVACLVTLVSAIALVFLIYSAIASVKQQTEENCFDYLNEATSRLAEDMEHATEMDHHVLSSMASVIAVTEDISDSKLLTILNSYATKTSYVTYMELLRPDNTMLDADGTVRDVSGKLNFVEEVNKGSYVSDICLSTKGNNEKVIRNAVPVQKDGKTIFMLYGVVKLSTFEKGYTTNIYHGNAYVYLIDGNTGDFFLDTWHNSYGNMSDFYNRKTILGETMQEASDKMKKGQAGQMAFLSTTTGDTLYMNYKPVGVNNWIVMVTVQDKYAMKNSNAVSKTLFWMAAGTGIVIFLYMLFVSNSLLAAYRRIQKLGMTDQVTGLKNRNAYDEYLERNRDEVYELLSCVFVDANGLHELNNRAGHDAGDEMLRSVAQAMQDIFPKAQLFRTGGDEFVAIVDGMSFEACSLKAAGINGRINQKGYSISYGVATEKNTSEISELISLADERMLENKRQYYSKHDRREQRS